MHLLFLALRCIPAGFLIAWAVQIILVVTDGEYNWRQRLGLTLLTIFIFALALFLVTL